MFRNRGRKIGRLYKILKENEKKNSKKDKRGLLKRKQMKKILHMIVQNDKI